MSMYRSELTCDVIEWRELVTSLRTAAGGGADVHVGLVDVAGARAGGCSDVTSFMVVNMKDLIRNFTKFLLCFTKIKVLLPSYWDEILSISRKYSKNQGYNLYCLD